MKSFTYTLLIFFCFAWACNDAYSQGCVAVRNMSTTCSMAFDSAMSHNGWQLSANYRYFRSFRHFKASHEEKHRVADNTEVINNDNSFLLGASYTHNRWNFSITVPLIYIDRSSLYEHDRVNRHYTSSKGLGDIRLSSYYSVMPQGEKGNLTVGLGVKLPTGDYNYKDYFHRAEGLELRPVDQSIQLGDGGLGISTEADFSRKLSRNLYGFATAFYLFNPRNTNGTRTFRSSPYEQIMSVADQFLFRAGARYSFNNIIQGSLAYRVEGIPAKDLIGKSEGFRRPGYISSIEPSVSVSVKKSIFAVNVPIAVYRKRTQNYSDKIRSAESGERVNGDAAFADYLLSITYAYRL